MHLNGPHRNAFNDDEITIFRNLLSTYLLLFVILILTAA